MHEKRPLQPLPESHVMAEPVKRLEARFSCFIAEISFTSLVALIGTVQLALRHPGNRFYTARVMRKLVDSMIATVAEHEPGLAELLRRGYEPDFDVKIADDV